MISLRTFILEHHANFSNLYAVAFHDGRADPQFARYFAQTIIESGALAVDVLADAESFAAMPVAEFVELAAQDAGHPPLVDVFLVTADLARTIAGPDSANDPSRKLVALADALQKMGEVIHRRCAEIVAGQS